MTDVMKGFVFQDDFGVHFDENGHLLKHWKQGTIYHIWNFK